VLPSVSRIIIKVREREVTAPSDSALIIPSIPSLCMTLYRVAGSATSGEGRDRV
jgi:hypothetical protein